MQQVRECFKTWETNELWISIMAKYNREVEVRANPNLECLTLLQIMNMCKSIDWYVCGNVSRVRTNSN